LFLLTLTFKKIILLCERFCQVCGDSAEYIDEYWGQVAVSMASVGDSNSVISATATNSAVDPNYLLSSEGTVIFF
jgi:hypothetical protein